MPNTQTVEKYIQINVAKTFHSFQKVPAKLTLTYRPTYRSVGTTRVATEKQEKKSIFNATYRRQQFDNIKRQ
jgi:hypothetical protein